MICGYVQVARDVFPDLIVVPHLFEVLFILILTLHGDTHISNGVLDVDDNFYDVLRLTTMT